MGWARRFPAAGRLQATTLALRLGRSLGRRGGSGCCGRSGRQAWRPPPTVADVAARRRADLPAGGRARYDALLAGPAVEPGLSAVLERALASGTPVDALDSLAGIWPELAARDREQLAAPLRLGRGARQLRFAGSPARQSDQTTCGSTVLAMLAAAGDPLFALWLVTGRRLAGHLPPEVRALAPADRSEPDAGARFAAVQRVIKSRSNRAALGPLPWPSILGTPPWGAARVARYPGAAYSAVMADDTDASGFGALLDRVERSLAAGVPVPLFTGGDLGSGLTTAIPRHVVLLVPDQSRPDRERPDREEAGAAAGSYRVFDPASGAVHGVTRAELLGPAGARAALGGWSHVCWAVLPRA